MSVADEIRRIKDAVAIQSNSIDAARTLLSQKQQKQPVIHPLNVTENGIYTASTNVDGYSPITVNIDTGSVVTSACGLKEIRYFDFTINPNDTGYGFKAAGLRFFIPNDQIMNIIGKNTSFSTPAPSSSWQAFGLFGMLCLAGTGKGRGAMGFFTMSNSSVNSYGAPNSGFDVPVAMNQADCVKPALEGDDTHQYFYYGTYRVFVFVHERGYSGEVTVAPADSNLVIVHPDYAETCSVMYPAS